MLRCCIIAILLLRVIALAECGFNTSSRAFIAAMRSITNGVWPTFCRMPKYSSELITRPRLHFPDPERSPVFFHRTLSLYENFPHLPLRAAIGVANKPKLILREREYTRRLFQREKEKRLWRAIEGEKNTDLTRKKGKGGEKDFFSFLLRGMTQRTRQGTERRIAMEGEGSERLLAKEGSFPFFFYSFSREEYEKLRVKISARRSWNRIKKLAKPIKAFRESLRDSSRKRVSFPGARAFFFLLRRLPPGRRTGRH